MFFDLDTHSPDDFADFGEHLFNRYSARYESLEEVAYYLVNELYSRVLNCDGNNVFSLIRIFRFGTFDSLHSTLQDQIEPEYYDIPYWMTLMGTYGNQPQWRHRAFSNGHQVFPAQTDFTPMIKETFNQMLLNPGDAMTEEDFRIVFNRDLPYKRFFHIEQALHSPHVPAQDDFVIPHNIQSVVGFGGSFVNRSGFLCIGFTQIPIYDEQLKKMLKIAPAIASILGLYEARGQVWQSS